MADEQTLLEALLNMSLRSACYNDKVFLPVTKKKSWDYLLQCQIDYLFQCQITRISRLSDGRFTEFYSTFILYTLRQTY